MSDSPDTNENMIQQGPPLVNQTNANTSARANNVIVHTPPPSPAPIHPSRLERRNNNRAPVLMCSDSDCPNLVLDSGDFDYDSVFEPQPNPNVHEMFDPSIYMYTGYGPVLERSDSIRHTGAADTSDLIQPSILTRSGFIPPPPLIRNDSRPVFDNDNEDDDDGPPPLIRLGSDIFPHVYDFPSDDEYDVVQRDNFEWFPKESSPP